MVAASTDVGIKKSVNEDSLAVKVYNTPRGKLLFAVLCDGMGGLAKGEVASATVVTAFVDWFTSNLPILSANTIEDSFIRREWERLVITVDEKIKRYGIEHNITLGTTLTSMLMTEERYYICNVGDTRAYEITDKLKQITEDHTIVAREVKLGKLTPDEANNDARKNILLQCIGASENIYPEMFFGETKRNAVYILCSDGFRHEITPKEIFNGLEPDVMREAEQMKRNIEYLINVNKQRLEQDNISVIAIRTF
ncbi:PP2C family protein-serine/threonine phosphatase [Acetivibrio clariflavus]|uniref:Serine/threonine protein phosphatase n=1 Tax=Acetivibrio clariflavus (strain DSM 19732 / NBRC 101661 / EBR45) TaxID=720554 RepID=G8LSA2_ACECE|nr:protein phosphatase 2C domain-containing protein [Acetivibrio clariflavus]AEV67163.1 serine/threonine protein phosphatase [Acetivibrio clariflavus DSM 19732]HOQ02160.1 protein phosphatase 2C domain-containing protein [Acetivibrio clariflavus]